MTTPATFTVDHVRALVAVLYPDDLTPSGRRVLLLACEHVEWEHALRQRSAYCPVHGPCVDTGKCPNCDYSEQQRPAVAEHHDRTRRMPDAVGFLGPLA